MEKDNLKKLFIMIISKSYKSKDLDICYLADYFIDVMYDLELGEEVSKLLEIAEKYEGSYYKFEGNL